MIFFLYTPQSGSKLLSLEHRFPYEWLKVETLENQSHRITWDPSQVIHVRLNTAEAGRYYRTPAVEFLRKIVNQALSRDKCDSMQCPILVADQNGTLLLWMRSEIHFIEWMEARLRLIAETCGRGAVGNFNKDWHICVDVFSSIEGYIPKCYCDVRPVVTEDSPGWSEDADDEDGCPW